MISKISSCLRIVVDALDAELLGRAEQLLVVHLVQRVEVDDPFLRRLALDERDRAVLGLGFGNAHRPRLLGRGRHGVTRAAMLPRARSRTAAHSIIRHGASSSWPPNSTRRPRAGGAEPR